MVCGEAEDRFERGMPVEAAVVAEDELVEIRVDMPAAQAVIRAQAPPLHQREDPVNPWQHDMPRHLADHARVVPVVGQSWIGCVAVGEQRRSALHVGPHEGLDRRGGIVRDHGKADAAGPGIEVFGPVPPRLGRIGVAIDHLDSSDNEDFSGVAGIEERVACAERDFRLIDLDDPFERLPVRIDHRSPQLLCQQPGGLVGEAELILQLPRRHPVGMRRHQMRGPKPNRQRELRAMHHGPCRDRGLTTAVETFVRVRPALQCRRTAATARRADEAARPAPFEQECRAGRLVGKRFLELRE